MTHPKLARPHSPILVFCMLSTGPGQRVQEADGWSLQPVGEKIPQSLQEGLTTGCWGSTDSGPQPRLEGQTGLLKELKSLRKPKEWERRGRERVPGDRESGEYTFKCLCQREVAFTELRKAEFGWNTEGPQAFSVQPREA